MMAGASTLELYRSRDATQILGISRRQLQYWAKTDLVRPSQRSPGGHHRYTFQDLVATTRESINKQIKSWSEEGMASMKNGIVTIHRIDDLEALAGFVGD